MHERPVASLIADEFPGEWGDPGAGDGLREAFVLRATNFVDGGLDYSSGARRFIPEVKVARKRLQRGDLILEAAGGGPGVPVGRVARFDPPDDRLYVVSNFFRTLRPAPGTDSRFTHHLLDHLYRQPKIWEVQQQTTGIINLKVRDYLRLRVPVPPQEEQRRIAEILGTIDATIQATERVIAKLWDARAGLLRERLNAVDSTYATVPLLSLVSLPSGQVDPKFEPFRSMTLVAPDHIVGGGRGRLLARESAGAQGAISGKYRFGRGDVVYSKIRPELRKAWLADSDGLCSADMYPLTPSESLDGGYLAQVILGDRFSRFAASVSGRSSGMPKVNREELSEFEIPVPPALVQFEIGRLAFHSIARIDAETALLEKLTSTRSGLAADLLYGRVRTVAA